MILLFFFVYFRAWKKPEQLNLKCLNCYSYKSTDLSFKFFCRYQAEEKDLESQVLAKGIRLTPIRKYEYQSAVWSEGKQFNADIVYYVSIRHLFWNFFLKRGQDSLSERPFT